MSYRHVVCGCRGRCHRRRCCYRGGAPSRCCCRRRRRRHRRRCCRRRRRRRVIISSSRRRFLSFRRRPVVVVAAPCLGKGGGGGGQGVMWRGSMGAGDFVPTVCHSGIFRRAPSHSRCPPSAVCSCPPPPPPRHKPPLRTLRASHLSRGNSSTPACLPTRPCPRTRDQPHSLHQLRHDAQPTCCAAHSGVPGNKVCWGGGVREGVSGKGAPVTERL